MTAGVPKITNLWARVARGGGGGRTASEVVIDSTAPLACGVEPAGPLSVALTLDGAATNMAPARIAVNDGLIDRVDLEVEAAALHVVIALEHPAEPAVRAEAGVPHRTIVSFDRGFLHGLFAGRGIAVDPGHGGRDRGGRGPINLWEKDVVMPVALELRALLDEAGARAALTRRRDAEVPLDKRIGAARAIGAELFVSVHTHWSHDRDVSGTATGFAPRGPGGGDPLARHVQRAVVKKLGLADRGLFERDWLVRTRVPSAEIEVVTISDPVEEGLLRSVTFHERAAWGIFNGIKDYLAAGGGG